MAAQRTPQVFLFIAILAGLALGKTLLTSGDFNYAGCFLLPRDVSSAGDIQFCKGLAHRYVGSELRFFVLAKGGPVYEFRAPATLSQTMGNASRAVEVDTWPGLSVGHAFADGMFWDTTDSRLYFAGGYWYNAQWPHDPSVGFANQNKQVQGAWAFGDVASGTARSSKALQGGVTHIPKWFSDLYCPGKRLGAGFGGYYSVISTGPVSMGPALTAFDPADMGRAPYVSESQTGIPHKPLVGYDGGNRCHRDGDYNSDYDGGAFNPAGGTGYWTWSDIIFQGGIWIDMPNKTGIIFFATMGNGHLWYVSSDRNMDAASHHAFFYDPADLAAVAQGTKQQYAIQPVSDWKVEFPGINYPLPGCRGDQEKHIAGVTFDSRTKKLYIEVAFPRSGVANWQDNTPAIFVYDVNDAVSTAARPWTTHTDDGFGLRINRNNGNPAICIAVTNSQGTSSRQKTAVIVHDINGRPIADLTEHQINGRMVWDASHLPGGMYIVTAMAGNRMLSKKVAIAK